MNVMRILSMIQMIIMIGFSIYYNFVASDIILGCIFINLAAIYGFIYSRSEE